MIIPSDNEALIAYLEQRALIDRKVRVQLDHPEISGFRDAATYWIEVFWQDSPFYLIFGGVALGGMVIKLTYITILSAYHWLI